MKGKKKKTISSNQSISHSLTHSQMGKRKKKKKVFKDP